MPSRVAVLDAGGQYVDLVRKAVERQGVPAEVLPLNTPRSELEAAYTAVIISGSPASSHTETAPQPDKLLWDSSMPLLGICYGMQAMVTAHGGQVTKNAIREDGRITTKVDTTHPLFQGLKPDFSALFTHGDFVTGLPAGFKVLGSHTLSNNETAYSAIGIGNKLGVQFHPEVFDDTPEGYQLFHNFLTRIAKLSPDPVFHKKQLARLITAKKQEIVRQAGAHHVIAFVSGGVDSSVAATLASKVIAAEKLHAYYIDSGFMRDEDEQVVEALNKAGLPVEKIDATDEFERATLEIDAVKHGPLIKAIDPEEKRQIIGKTFIDIQNRLVSQLNIADALLLQGTNAADRIESGHSVGDSNTMKIKTHHNQVKEVRELKENGFLIEPLDDLFKDEIRDLGRQLGLPQELVQRQPFPGPGLAIRIICSSPSITQAMPQVEQAEIDNFLQTRGFTELKAQLLPVRSVGVGGDERSHLAVLAVQQEDMGANQLAELVHIVPGHFRSAINRVIYALGPSPIERFTLTETHLTRDARSQLREADAIVFQAMRTWGLLEKVSQFPVVLLPLSFHEPGMRTIVLRPVRTSTFMTVQAMLPGRDLPDEFLYECATNILQKVSGISQVFLDLTNKPPATTEWE